MGFRRFSLKEKYSSVNPIRMGGNERRELYRLANGNYLAGSRFRDRGDVLINIKVTENRPEDF